MKQNNFRCLSNGSCLAKKGFPSKEVEGRINPAQDLWCHPLSGEQKHLNLVVSYKLTSEKKNNVFVQMVVLAKNSTTAVKLAFRIFLT